MTLASDAEPGSSTTTTTTLVEQTMTTATTNTALGGDTSVAINSTILQPVTAIASKLAMAIILLLHSEGHARVHLQHFKGQKH